MARVCFLTHPAAGHIYTAVDLMKSLIIRGEQIEVYSSNSFRERILEVGASFIPYVLDEEDSDIDAYFRNLITLHKERMNKVENRDANGLDAIFPFFDQLCKFYKSVEEKMASDIIEKKYDYIIHDSCCPLGKWIAKKINIPAVCIMPNQVFKHDMLFDDPTLFFRVFLKKDPTGLSNEQVIKQTNRFIYIMDNFLMQRYGFDKDFSSIDTMISEEELNLVFSSQELQPYGKRYGNNYVFIGPAIQTNQKLDLEIKHPIIHIALGTINNNNDIFYNACIRLFKDYPYTIVMAVGNNTHIENWGNIPDNFIIAPFFKQQRAILEQSVLFITHGGTSMNDALYYNVPLLTVDTPNAYSDHILMCEQAQRLNVGIHINTCAITYEVLKFAVEKIFDNYLFYKNNSTKIGDTLRNAGGSAVGADRILEYVAKYNKR